MIDWSHEGVVGNLNPRYGRLLNLDRLSQPLGQDFLLRPQKAAIFASHLREPRRTLLNAVKKQIEVIEYGRSFNLDIKNHLESGIVKYEELQKVAFNLCPENGMHPGYYTEKIPEAFMAGCLPITWTDENVKVDFNPKAFINLAPMSSNNFVELQDILHSKKLLSAYAEEALLLNKPSLDQLKKFIKNIIIEALN
jgi:sulfur relay (sulfurtransferase) DsrF/TusC family protein